MFGKHPHKCPPKIDGGCGFYLSEEGKTYGGMWGVYLINGTPEEIWLLIPVEELTDVTRRSIIEKMRPESRRRIPLVKMPEEMYLKGLI